MISFAILSLVASKGPQIHELLGSEGSGFQFAAVIAIPPEMDDVCCALQEAVRLLPDGTALHRRRAIADLNNGRGVQAWTTSDQVIIRASLDSGSITDAVTLAYGLIYRPLLEPREEAEFSSGWYTPLWQRLSRRQPSESETRDAWRYLVRNGKIHVVFGGPFAAGQSVSVWQGLMDAEPMTIRPADRPRPDGFPRFPAVNAAWLDGGVVAPSDSVPAAMVSALLLGQGKSSVLYRVAREEMGLSYRQEAFLWPRPAGWQPRIYLTSADPIPVAKLEQLKERMLAEVSGWNASDLNRAQQMLTENLLRNGVWSPWVIGPAGGTYNTAEDRIVLEALSQSNGAAYDANSLVTRAESLTLETVQAAAKSWLGHDWQVITANP